MVSTVMAYLPRNGAYLPVLLKLDSSPQLSPQAAPLRIEPLVLGPNRTAKSRASPPEPCVAFRFRNSCSIQLATDFSLGLEDR